MDKKIFNKFLESFRDAPVEQKIDLYCTTTDLTEDQYMILLKNFPMNQIGKLEKVLNS